MKRIMNVLPEPHVKVSIVVSLIIVYKGRFCQNCSIELWIVQ